MVQSARHWNFPGITDKCVLRAMNHVPRHLFVPENLREFAYENQALPIERGQTISQPFIVAAMTQALQIKTRLRVLEVGTGSGYQAAVLAEVASHVYSIEIDPVLAKLAASRLNGLGYNNVTVKTGDGYHGWPEHAPYDGIMVTAATEKIPGNLLHQLRDGGKLIIPLGPPRGGQNLFLFEKNKGTITSRSFMAVRFVPFRRSPGENA